MARIRVILVLSWICAGCVARPTAVDAPAVDWKRTLRVRVDDGALRQLQNVARLPVIHGHVAVMPDVHWGIGATIGSVIPTAGAVIPAAVGVDLGCGMCAVQTSLVASDLPDDLDPRTVFIKLRELRNSW